MTTRFRGSLDIDEVGMRKSRYIVVAVAILLTVSVLFVACAKGNKFEMSGGKYVDKTSGITY